MEQETDLDMKYIDADKLKAKLDEHYRNYQSKYMEARNPYTLGLIDALDLAKQVIDSLQQEQPDFPTTDEQMKEFLATHPKVEVPNKYKTPDWLWKKQEQPKVDLEKEIIRYKVPFSDDKEYLNETTLDSIARHFYELGLRRAAEMYDEIEYNRQRAEEESK